LKSAGPDPAAAVKFVTYISRRFFTRDCRRIVNDPATGPALDGERNGEIVDDRIARNWHILLTPNRINGAVGT
jgi:hypothetical protein